jgi:HSP20 family molecular chaperone IbpA
LKHIKGRTVTDDGKKIETKFEKRFTIGDNVDTSKLTANLSDGVLTVTAPKLTIKAPEPIKIEITENKMAIEDKK